MQAVVVTAFGDAGALRLTEMPTLSPGPGQVVIAVEAAGVGLADVLQRRGLLGGAAGFVPGLEAAGRVQAVGPGADAALVGRGVFAWGRGSYAEQFLATVDRVVVLPEAVSSETAVALGVNALTARFSLDRAQVTAGERVLVRGASGGVGAMTVRLAAARGAQVTAVTNAAAATEVAALGATHVLRRGVDAEPEGPFDAIIDPVAGAAVPHLLATLAPNGRYLINGAAGGFPPPDFGMALLPLFGRSPTLSLFSLDTVADVEATRAAREMFEAVARGELLPPLAETLPLAKAAEAHRRLEAGVFGKIVLRP